MGSPDKIYIKEMNKVFKRVSQFNYYYVLSGVFKCFKVNQQQLMRAWGNKRRRKVWKQGKRSIGHVQSVDNHDHSSEGCN